MPALMQCHIVSAEAEIYSGRIAMLSATGTLGELGILPGHAALLTGIRPGPVRLRDENGDEEVFYAAGGYLEVQPGVVTVLADTALRASDIDEAAAAQAQQEAERALSESAAEMDYGLVQAQLAAATAQQRTLEELRKARR